jgi:hypothetical protein
MLASHSLTDKELNAQLTDEANLRAILLEELYVSLFLQFTRKREERREKEKEKNKRKQSEFLRLSRHAHNVNDERDIVYIVRLLRGLILSMGRKHGKEGNEDLVRWLFSGTKSSVPLKLLSSYNISEVEYAEVNCNLCLIVHCFCCVFHCY